MNNSKIDKYYSKNNIGNVIIQDLYSFDENILFQFKKYPSEPHISNKLFNSRLPKSIKKINDDIYETQIKIDKYNKNNYQQITQLTRLYKPSLSQYVQKHLGIQKSSRAFFKMYEILYSIPQLIKNKSKLKSFHICEAPGNFILSFKHFINTKTNINNWDWIAQSLNPHNKDNIKKYGKVLSDQYDLMKKYPNKWKWGKDNTGDITSTNNIKDYKKLCKDIDVITSDCGLSRNPDFSLHESYHLVGFSQFLFIFNNLKKNGNCVMKLFFPISSQKISLIYMAYLAFDIIYIYKPVLNPGSEEFYLIGINYKNVVSDKMLKLMFDLSKKYDKKKCMYNISKLPIHFTSQLNKVLTKISINYIKYINKKLYYLDNAKNINDDHVNYLHNIINEKNKDWIYMFEFEPAKSEQKFKSEHKKKKSEQKFKKISIDHIL